MSANRAYCLLWVSIILLQHRNIWIINCESINGYASSIVGVEKLVQMERYFIEALGQYASEMEKKAKIVRSGIKSMREENDKSRNNSEAYLSNPLNSFALIRRLYADWPNWLEYSSKSTGIENFQDILETSMAQLPTYDDLLEAIDGMQRIQKTYNIKAVDMALGYINGKQYSTNLSTLDALTIAQELYKQQKFRDASSWLSAALKSDFDTELYEKVFDTNIVEMLKFQADLLLLQKDDLKALSAVNQALEIYPHDEDLLKQKTLINSSINKGDQTPLEYPIERSTDCELCCRGDFSQKSSKLHCRYNQSTNAFLILAPFKMEELSIDPYVVLFHDILSDDEIEHLKETIKPDLERATVFDEKTSTAKISNNRVSKMAWLCAYADCDDKSVKIIERVADITGFDKMGFERMNLINYGLGGYYVEHVDFFSPLQDEYINNYGDRVATALIYLNDVEQGGATVFPKLKLSVLPRKATALVWYNLNNRGDPDYRTSHSGCPVIVGSKWVGNIWIRELAQFRAKPCYKE